MFYVMCILSQLKNKPNPPHKTRVKWCHILLKTLVFPPFIQSKIKVLRVKHLGDMTPLTPWVYLVSSLATWVSMKSLQYGSPAAICPIQAASPAGNPFPVIFVWLISSPSRQCSSSPSPGGLSSSMRLQPSLPLVICLHLGIHSSP